MEFMLIPVVLFVQIAVLGGSLLGKVLSEKVLTISIRILSFAMSSFLKFYNQYMQ